MPSLTSPISADNIRQRYDSFVKEAILNTTIISEYDVTSNPIPGAPGPSPTYYAIYHDGTRVQNLVRFNQSGSFPRMNIWSPSTESLIDLGPQPAAAKANLQSQVMASHAMQFKSSDRPGPSIPYDWYYETEDSGQASEITRRAEDNFPLFANTNNTVTVDADDLVRFIYRETAAWIFIRNWKFVSGVYGVGGNLGTKFRNSPYRYPGRVPLGYTTTGGPVIVHNGKQLYFPAPPSSPAPILAARHGDLGIPTGNPVHVKYAMDNVRHYSHVITLTAPLGPRVWTLRTSYGPKETPYVPGTSNTDPVGVQKNPTTYDPIVPLSGTTLTPYDTFNALPATNIHENILDIGPEPTRMPSTAHFSESAIETAAATAGLVSGNTITTTNLDAFLTAVRDRYYAYANTDPGIKGEVANTSPGTMDVDKIKPRDLSGDLPGTAAGPTVNPVSQYSQPTELGGSDADAHLVFFSGFSFLLSGAFHASAPTAPGNPLYANTTLATINVVCHASCHSSCHSSRGRR